MPKQTFSQKLQRLEEITTRLERADMELEEGLALLEEGVKLHQECQELLTQSQVKISTLLQNPKQPASNETAGLIDEQVALFEIESEDDNVSDQPSNENPSTSSLPF